MLDWIAPTEILEQPSPRAQTPMAQVVTQRCPAHLPKLNSLLFGAYRALAVDEGNARSFSGCRWIWIAMVVEWSPDKVVKSHQGYQRIPPVAVGGSTRCVSLQLIVPELLSQILIQLVSSTQFTIAKSAQMDAFLFHYEPCNIAL